MPDLSSLSLPSVNIHGHAGNGGVRATPYQGAGTHATATSASCGLQGQSRQETCLGVDFGSFPSTAQMHGMGDIHSNAAAQVNPGQQQMATSLSPFHFNGSATLSGEGQQHNNAHHFSTETLMDQTLASGRSDRNRQVQPECVRALLQRASTHQPLSVPAVANDRRIDHGHRRVSTLFDLYLGSHQLHQQVPILPFNTIGHAQFQGLTPTQQLGSPAPAEESMSGTGNGLQKVPCTAQRYASLETLDRRVTSGTQPRAISAKSATVSKSQTKDENAGIKQLVQDVLRKHEMQQQKILSRESSH